MSYMNRLANVSNRFQTPAKRVLAVCSAGLLRSPTVANVLHAEHGFNTRACGAHDEYALIRMDDVLIEWADEIVFVEKEVYDLAVSVHGSAAFEGKRLVILGLPDQYQWNDPELRSLIVKQYEDAVVMEKAVSK